MSSQRTLCCPRSNHFLLWYFLKVLHFLCFIFKSVTHVELILYIYMWNLVIVLFLFFLACGYPIALASFLEKSILSALISFCTFLKNHLTIFMWVYFWVLYFHPLICLSIPPSVLHYLDCCSYTVRLTSRGVIPSTLLFFIKHA